MPPDVISTLKVKVFADGADKASLLEMAKLAWVKGFTTNPTLMRKAGINDYRAFAKDVLSSIREKPISFEVFADDFANMGRQAREIATWGPNVYVKIPVTTSKGEPSTALIRELSHASIKLNVTAVFTLEQVRAVVGALKGGAPAVVSVFAGRIADTGADPVPHMRSALSLCRAADPKIELLWASPRELRNIVEAHEAGCDIITVSPDLLRKVDNLGKSLEQFSLETVQMFKRDAEAAGYSL